MLANLSEILTALGLASSATPQDLALANLVHRKAERAVKKYLGYDVEQATYSEYYPEQNFQAPQALLIAGYELAGGRATPVEWFADDRRILQLRQLPVRSVSAVYEDTGAWLNGFPPSFQTLLNNGDYMIDDPGDAAAWSGMLFRLSGVWTNRERCVKVVYTAGLTAQELGQKFTEFRDAVVETAAVWFNAMKSMRPNPVTGNQGGAVTNESIDGVSWAYHPEVQARLMGFMHQLPPSAASLLEDRVRYSKYLS